MKLPIIREDGKRMMTVSGTSTGGKALGCERRESSLVGSRTGRGVQQIKGTMDLGSGDTSDYFPDIQTNYDSFNWESRFDSHDYQPAQSSVTKTHRATTPPPPPPPQTQAQAPTVPLGALSASSESIGKTNEVQEEERTELFRGKEDSRKSTLAVVEDNKQPSFTANESNPTVPAPTEPSKTSTLRLSDRTRSESEDDIEKMDEPEQDGALIGSKPTYKTSATTENSPNSEKMDKNGNRSDLNSNESDNDCVVQCLYYTIQCCECVIF